MRVKLLFVENDLWQAHLVKRLLQDHNFDIRWSGSGEEPLHYLEHYPFDLLLVSMELAHGMDGLETFMRAKIMRPHLKGLLASRYWGLEFLEEVKQCGFSGSISKPFTTQSLLEAIGSVIG